VPAPLTEDQFVGEVRGFLRDFTELNRLISGEETSDRMVRYCISLAVDEWNTTPPLSSHEVSNFPSRGLLLHLTVINLLTSVGILKSRNSFAYSDGGFTVQTEEHDSRYQRWIQMFRSTGPASFQSIRNLKIALNLQGGWGAGLGSEYGLIHGWYGTP
jgi:hypothetical protein